MNLVKSEGGRQERLPWREGRLEVVFVLERGKQMTREKDKRVDLLDCGDKMTAAAVCEGWAKGHGAQTPRVSDHFKIQHFF